MSAAPEMTLDTITPERAQEMLALNTKNRRISRKTSNTSQAAWNGASGWSTVRP
jgi:hypothetical protein